MSHTCLHIIAFSIPYPPDYGGVIDVFYKIKSLNNVGIKVILHAFEYGGRKRSEELEKICKKVYYYPRSSFLEAYFSKIPYIVQSRKSDQLLINLQNDNFPVLFEGIHTTAFIESSELKQRLKIVRMHNLEDEYYSHLGNREKNIFKKYYYSSEAIKLKFYQQKLSFADYILCLSENDKEKLIKTVHGLTNEKILVSPVFHPFSDVVSKEGRGEYVLFHGDLSVNENQTAVYFLLNEVFNDLKVPLTIAGKKPSRKLVSFVENKIKEGKNEGLKLISNPDEVQMSSLIEYAHINILPAFQETGIKLKLIYSLFSGRFCIVNPQMLYGTNLDDLCVIFHSPKELKELILNIVQIDFTKEMISRRREV